MKETLLEICVDSVESAIAAKNGGADRLELCSNLIIGGTTPGLGLYRMAAEKTGLPVRVLIRPRFGDFCYSPYEKGLILEEIRQFRQAGAQGVVIGALRPDGSMDRPFLEQCMEEAGGCRVTCHRAFDMCSCPESALEELIGLGVDTVLTSGQAASAEQGRQLLEKLNLQARGRIRLLAGGGVCASSIPGLYRKAGIRHFHLSAKSELDSRMKYRNPAVSMGVAGLSEYIIWQTDEKKVREVRSVLDELEKKE